MYNLANQTKLEILLGHVVLRRQMFKKAKHGGHNVLSLTEISETNIHLLMFY